MHLRGHCALRRRLHDDPHGGGCWRLLRERAQLLADRRVPRQRRAEDSLLVEGEVHPVLADRAPFRARAPRTLVLGASFFLAACVKTLHRGPLICVWIEVLIFVVDTAISSEFIQTTLDVSGAMSVESHRHWHPGNPRLPSTSGEIGPICETLWIWMCGNITGRRSPQESPAKFPSRVARVSRSVVPHAS